jgi:hypothetical protein
MEWKQTLKALLAALLILAFAWVTQYAITKAWQRPGATRGAAGR